MGGTTSQPTGIPSGQGLGQGTGAPPTGMLAPQEMQPSGGSSGGGGGGGAPGRGGGGRGDGGSGRGTPGTPAPPPGRQAVAQGAPIAGPLPAANGALRGHPPKIFDGQQKNTQKFVKEFTLWKMCNLRNEAMTNPFQ